MIPRDLYAFAVMRRQWSFQVRSLDMMTPRYLWELEKGIEKYIIIEFEFWKKRT